MGPLPVEARVTSPPPSKFSVVGANNDFDSPKIRKVYNNSNLVNNEVFKKLTTIFYGNLV